MAFRSPLARLPRRVKRHLHTARWHGPARKPQRVKLIIRYYIRLARVYKAWEAAHVNFT